MQDVLYFPVLPGGLDRHVPGLVPLQRLLEGSDTDDSVFPNLIGFAGRSDTSSSFYCYDGITSAVGYHDIRKPPPPKVFECSRCHQKFGHPRSIYRHRKACEGQFDFKCEVCGKCFHRLDSLKSHAQKHVGEAAAQFRLGEGQEITPTTDKQNHE